MTKPPNKWNEIYKTQQDKDNPLSPTDTEAEIRSRILNTQMGGAVDTQEELDAQRHNLGPKDTTVENTDDQDMTAPRPG